MRACCPSRESQFSSVGTTSPSGVKSPSFMGGLGSGILIQTLFVSGLFVLLTHPIFDLSVAGIEISASGVRGDGALGFSGFMSGGEDLDGIEMLHQLMYVRLQDQHIFVFSNHGNSGVMICGEGSV
jgi:hypothetical protein